jgi:hypothetical protein
MVYGNKPVDGGNLFMTDAEKSEFLNKEPRAEKYVRRILGSQEFINGENRWCLWLKDAMPGEIRTMPEIMRRVEAVRKFRMQSKKAATVRQAEAPSLFAEIRQTGGDYLLVPLVSSEHRTYIPLGFFTGEVIVNNLASIVPDATLYHFGVLTSTMHMAWMRQVCGRLKSDYRYSNNLVYNNFPWPETPSPMQIERVTKSARRVLDIRAEFIDSTLADLYDPDAMPKQLLDAHRILDSAVDLCYRPTAFKTALERLKFLFDLYRKYTEPLVRASSRSMKTKKAHRG